MLATGDAVEVTLDKPAAGGEMLARLDGQVMFVSGGIPGERVRVRVERVAKKVAHARVAEILEPSPDRRAGTTDPLCGGCLYSHIAYPRQLAIKAQVIADAFLRIGKIALPDDVAVAASPEEGYRMRARLHARGSRLGFFREGTHDICDARATRQLLPESCDVLDRLMAAARSLGVAEHVREIELSENVDASERVVHIESPQPLERRVLDALMQSDGLTPGPHVTDVVSFDGLNVSLRRHVLAFFQGNRHLLRELAAHVAGQVEPGSRVTDLYAGAGLFALTVATLRNATVMAVEGDRYAAEDLHANAAVSNGRVESKRASVESFAAGMTGSDAVIVDPPRTGMTPDALNGVLRSAPARLIYVSCDVATLARDAKAIVAEGYRISSARAFDLFPNTPHVETVIAFDR